MRTSAILLAAGRGRRMGQGVNKVFLPVGGVSILARAALAFAQVPRIDELIVVAHPDEMALAADALPPLDIPVRVVEGGAERHDSALAGVTAATGDVLLIHDAARPFPSQDLIERVIEGTLRHGACIPVIPVVDTLRLVNADGTASGDPVERDRLSHVQTPQGFRAEIIRQALAEWRSGVLLLDDAAAVLACGIRVVTVAGNPRNLKVTTPADLEFAGHVAVGSQGT